ncbi:uncharacterized protein LOC133659716 isoform X1 [Entelurus aequoreus]|uniref:uncharacterized protein LOC133659716 isoform X1 n=1 Tax=Entelurus aequoreus TaxID=161455 RepID=UPI002B1E8132|nr:uncharacterized protein LOC133659716 isoform X1 [Entelurus aequoreus]
MTLAPNSSVHAHLRDDEVQVVENAIRLAVDSILNVLYGVNSGRSREYQRMVADRDKEIQRLEDRMRAMEADVHARRRCCNGCACAMASGSARDQVTSPRSGELQAGEERADGGDTEPEVGQQELSFSLGLFASPSVRQEAPAALPLPPISRAGPHPDSADPSGTFEASGKSPSPSSSGLAVKEEPCDIDAVLIKWEMSEERFREQQERDGGLCWDEEQLEDMEGMNYGDADAVAQRMTEAQQLSDINVFGRVQFCHPVATNLGEEMRSRKKRVSMADLPEEAQRLKRAAWRAASRRYYARKVARQQSALARPGPFHHQMEPHYSASPPNLHCLAFGSKRKRAPISMLPQESQAQQREAWRASSRRYYHSRKTALHQTAPSHYPLQNTEPSGDAHDGGDLYADTEGLGGILCS